MIKKSSTVEIKKAFFNLPPSERTRLLEELEEKLFRSRFREIISTLRSKAKTSSLKKITKIAQRVRKKLHEEDPGRR